MTYFIYERDLRYTQSFTSHGRSLSRALWRIKSLRRQKPISSEPLKLSR
mgnify:CR=1 FL=1